MKVRLLFVAATFGMILTGNARAEFVHTGGAGVVIDSQPVAPPPRYEWTTESSTVRRSGKNLGGSETLTTTVTANRLKIETKPFWDTIQFPTVTCAGNAGNGSKSNWGGFFTERGDKALMLASAIRGLTPQEANYLIQYGFFHTKPRSWDAFRSEIIRAQNVLGTDLATRVLLGFNGDQNMDNLGYYDPQNCQKVMAAESVLTFKEIPTVVNQKSQDFAIIISGAPLLAGESEQFTVDYDGLNYSIKTKSSSNKYPQKDIPVSTNGGKIAFHLQGERQKVKPSIEPVQVNYSVKNGNIQLEVTDKTFDPAAAKKVQLNLTTTLKGFFKHGLGEKSFELTGPTTVIDTGVKAQSKGKYYLKYNINMVDSAYYKDDRSSSKNDTFYAPK